MSSAKLSGLATVQDLYVLHLQLVECVREGLRTPDQRKKAKEHLRRFSSLLATADWRYMGGEDVYESLQGVRKDISAKIGRSTIQKVAPRKLASRKSTSRKVHTTYSAKLGTRNASGGKGRTKSKKR